MAPSPNRVPVALALMVWLAIVAVSVAADDDDDVDDESFPRAIPALAVAKPGAPPIGEGGNRSIAEVFKDYIVADWRHLDLNEPFSMFLLDRNGTPFSLQHLMPTIDLMFKLKLMASPRAFSGRALLARYRERFPHDEKYYHDLALGLEILKDMYLTKPPSKGVAARKPRSVVLGSDLPYATTTSGIDQGSTEPTVTTLPPSTENKASEISTRAPMPPPASGPLPSWLDKKYAGQALGYEGRDPLDVVLGLPPRRYTRFPTPPPPMSKQPPLPIENTPSDYNWPPVTSDQVLSVLSKASVILAQGQSTERMQDELEQQQLSQRQLIRQKLNQQQLTNRQPNQQQHQRQVSRQQLNQQHPNQQQPERQQRSQQPHQQQEQQWQRSLNEKGQQLEHDEQPEQRVLLPDMLAALGKLLSGQPPAPTPVLLIGKTMLVRVGSMTQQQFDELLHLLQQHQEQRRQYQEFVRQQQQATGQPLLPLWPSAELLRQYPALVDLPWTPGWEKFVLKDLKK